MRLPQFTLETGDGFVTILCEHVSSVESYTGRHAAQHPNNIRSVVVMDNGKEYKTRQTHTEIMDGINAACERCDVEISGSPILDFTSMGPDRDTLYGPIHPSIAKHGVPERPFLTQVSKEHEAEINQALSSYTKAVLGPEDVVDEQEAPKTEIGPGDV